MPFKTCSYSCVYCQLGQTPHTTTTRARFGDPAQTAAAIEGRLTALAAAGEHADHVTFVPDGEPTLDLGLGRVLELLRDRAIASAVITNGSLLGLGEVREALSTASWISVKVDAGDERTWRAINQPAAELSFAADVEGARELAASFAGTLVTETMLVAGLNDDEACLERIASRVSQLAPQTAYLALPTRPPGCPDVGPPDEAGIARATAIFSEHGLDAQLLAGYPEPDFAATSDVGKALLEITAVHPLREVEVRQLLHRSGASRTELDELLDRGELRRVEYRGQHFYVRSHAASAGEASGDP